MFDAFLREVDAFFDLYTPLKPTLGPPVDLDIDNDMALLHTLSNAKVSSRCLIEEFQAEYPITLGNRNWTLPVRIKPHKIFTFDRERLADGTFISCNYGGPLWSDGHVTSSLPRPLGYCVNRQFVDSADRAVFTNYGNGPKDLLIYKRGEYGMDLVRQEHMQEYDHILDHGLVLNTKHFTITTETKQTFNIPSFEASTLTKFYLNQNGELFAESRFGRCFILEQ